MAILLIGIIGLGLIEITGLILLRSQIGRYKSYWQQQASVPAAPDALWYVALGDSAAQGIGASKPANGYVGLVADSLHRKTGRNVHIVNLSVSGAKVEDVINDQLPQLQRLTLPKDSVITLEIGANNMAHYEPHSFEQQLDTLLAAMPPQTVVADVPFFGKGIFRNRETSVVAANQIVHQLTAKHNLKPAPLHEITMAQSSWLNNAADMFHPNNRGYRVWYQAFWQVLDKS